MYQSGRSYDYYDMKIDDQDETENGPQQKSEKTFSESKINPEQDEQLKEEKTDPASASKIDKEGLKEETRKNDKDNQMKQDNGPSSANNVAFDPTKYMKVNNKNTAENKKNSTSTSTKPESKDIYEELQDKIKRNLTLEGTELIYKMELVEGNKLNPEEIRTKAPADDGKPMFFIDPTPLAVFTKKDDEIIYIPIDKKEKDTEKRYYVVGQERYFKTQEKSLVEKLNKFLKKPNEKPEVIDLEGKEDDALLLDPEMNNSINRYFSHNIGEVCRRCKKTGHFERMCPEEAKTKCTFCMGPHEMDRCTQIVCFGCYKTGHRAKDCFAPKAQVCYRCGKKGHKREDCGMLMLKETHRDKKGTEKETKCLKCHKFGHIACQHINLGNKGHWKDDLFSVQLENSTKPVTHPQQKMAKREHVYFRESSDDGRFHESEDISEDLSDTHLNTFLKSYSKEELQLMSSEESEREVKRFKKHEKNVRKEKKVERRNRSEERKNMRNNDKQHHKNGFRKQSKFVEKRIQDIKRDRKRSSSRSQPKIKKVKSY